MGLFGRRKKLNTAAIAAPPASVFPPEQTVIHNHAYSRSGVIFSLFFVLVVGSIFSWLALVFLVEQMGYKQPAETAASCVVGIGIIFAILSGMGALAKFFLNDFLTHRERMMEKYIELEQARSRVAQLIPPTTQARMTREESRKYLAVKLVMDRAFQRVDQAGKLLGKVEPWSRREVGKLILINEREPIGENSNLASWVKSYLLDKNILLGDRQINLAEFPNLSTIEGQLVKDLGQPVIYRAGDNGGMSTHYLEKGTKRESWG